MLLKKTILGIAICFGLIFSMHLKSIAQEKVTIGILPVKASDGKEINEITDALTTAFSRTKRFFLVDRTQMNAIKQEKQLQKTDDFIDGSTVQQGKNLGVQFLISGALNSYQNDGSVCKFSLNLSVIDVSTGQVISCDVIDVKGGSHAGAIIGAFGNVAIPRSNTGQGDQAEALKKALNGVSAEIDKFVSTNFPK